MDSRWTHDTLTLARRYGWNSGVFEQNGKTYEEKVRPGKTYLWTSDDELKKRGQWKGRHACTGCGTSIHIPRTHCGDCRPEHTPEPKLFAEAKTNGRPITNDFIVKPVYYFGFGSKAEFNHRRTFGG
jgi:hypothetical protein